MESASRRYPSFSSTLLDHIYRSMDNDKDDDDHEQPPPTQSQSIHTKFRPSFEDDAAHKQPLTGRKSAADDLQMRYAPTDQSFSTGLLKLKLKPKPIRRDDDIMKLPRNKQDSKTKQKDEGKFVKTRLKALKIYGDLKKVKQQPISPGGRLATFLNSLFINNNNNNNNKKPNTDAAGLDRKSKSANASTCSSASSVSRSSVSSSNIPSSRPTLSKRSVRFYPEYCQPSSLHQHQTKLNNKLNLSTDHTHKNRHISEAARNLLKNYQNKVEFDSTRNINAFENQTHDDDDDGGSDSSSDLFELENLSASRYREELPVYETTRLDTNPLFM